MRRWPWILSFREEKKLNLKRAKVVEVVNILAKVTKWSL
jgi:hypothetical protein